MLLVFRIVRKYATKNTSLLHEFFNKTNKYEILNYIKNLTAFHTDYVNFPRSKGSNNLTLKYLKNGPSIFFSFLNPYRIKITFEYFDVSNWTCQNAFKIDETSAHRSMEKTTTTRRRRRRTNAFRAVPVKTIKKRKRRHYKNKKIMHNFYLNNPPLVSQFPPSNDVNKILVDSQQSFENFAQVNVTDAHAKSFSDVLKDNSLLHSKGTNLKEFLNDVRYDIYTPYGQWLKESWVDDRAKAGVLFKVVSYNILSQHLLETHHDNLYTLHDPKYLQWDYRKNALIGEFTECDADILCFQEVEANKLDFFNTELGKLGYRGIFKKRTNDKEDGCAIYYRVEKFDLKEYAAVEYNQPYIRLLNRDNIGIVARLSCKQNDQNVVVANTHLLFNPNRHDIKLAQLTMLLAEVDRIAFRSQGENHTAYHPAILCGDLNLKPYTYGYNLLVDGYVENFTSCFRDRRGNRWPNNRQLMPTHLGITDGCQHYDVVKNRGSRRSAISDFKYVRLYNSDRKSLNTTITEPEWRREQLNTQLFGSGVFYHGLNLSSVYPQVHPEFGNASTYQDSWCNVDYIFYGPRKMVNGQKEDDELKLVSYLRLPTYSEAETLKTIPNEACGSDHLPLIATFHLPNTM